jgi:uncharacterized membrane protein YesL
MISAFKVLWKTAKDLFEELLLLVLMNILTLVCGIPMIAAVGLPIYIAYASQTQLVPALIIAILLDIPASIPFGAALFGLYTVCDRTANGFAISWEHYFSFFKKGFWKAWLFVAFSNTITLLIILNFIWYPQSFSGEWVAWVMGLWLAAALFWTAIQFYAIPFYIEQEDKSFRIALKNAALIAGANPLFTLLLLVVSVALMGLCITFIPPLFVIGGLIFWTLPGTEGAVNRIEAFRKRMEQEEAKKKGTPLRKGDQ